MFLHRITKPKGEIAMKIKKTGLVTSIIYLALPTASIVHAPAKIIDQAVLEYKMSRDGIIKPKKPIDITTSVDLWQMMGASDWDKFSIQSRVKAFDNMRTYWIDHYHDKINYLSNDEMYDILRAMCIIESDYDHRAQSDKGAMGLYQIISSTRDDLKAAYRLGEFELDVNDDSSFFNPFANTAATVYEFNKRLKYNKGDVPRTIQSWGVGQTGAEEGSIAAQLYETLVNSKRKLASK